jgi:hypothetical protein
MESAQAPESAQLSEPLTSASPASPAGQPGKAGKAVARTLSWRALGLMVTAGVAGFALITLMPGLDTRTRVMLSFILAPVVVTPILGGLGGFSRATLVIGSVLGGEIAALLYATGQYQRFSAWLFAVEIAALLLAPPTLRMLRLARVPGVPPGEEMPALHGIALIIAASPFALAAAILDAMARFPVAAIASALLASIITVPAGGNLVGSVAAALLALAPAAIRWLILRARHPRG